MLVRSKTIEKKQPPSSWQINVEQNEIWQFPARDGTSLQEIHCGKTRDPAIFHVTLNQQLKV